MGSLHALSLEMHARNWTQRSLFAFAGAVGYWKQTEGVHGLKHLRLVARARSRSSCPATGCTRPGRGTGSATRPPGETAFSPRRRLKTKGFASCAH